MIKRVIKNVFPCEGIYALYNDTESNECDCFAEEIDLLGLIHEYPHEHADNYESYIMGIELVVGCHEICDENADFRGIYRMPEIKELIKDGLRVSFKEGIKG